MNGFKPSAAAGSLLLVVSLTTPLIAQTALENAHFRVGPVGLSPRISLSNVGIDSNADNAAQNPQRDFTATFLPGIDSVLRIGPAVLSGQSALEFLYFSKRREQRSRGYHQDVRLDFLFTRIRPFAFAGRAVSFQRPNAEIDARARREMTTAGGGLQLQAGSRLQLELQSARGAMRFADLDLVEGNLADALDRRLWSARVLAGFDLTPLTTLTAQVEMVQDRFDNSPFRDTNNVTVLVGFKMKPFALISGSAEVGLKNVASKTKELPDFLGVAAAVDVAYVWREMTRLTLGVTRNVEPSLEADQPYYVATAGTTSVTQILGTRWDVVARGSRQFLDYRNRLTDSTLTNGRRDRVDSAGVGIGFRSTPDLRIGFDANYNRRVSGITRRTFEGYRFGGTVTYGS